jgi:hypothetical protein
MLLLKNIFNIMSDFVLKNKRKSIDNRTKKRLFKEYKKILKENKQYLKDNHNLNIDWVNRLWKVYTVPIEEKYNIYQYGNKYLNELVKKDLAEINKTIMKIGLLEIIGIVNLDVIDNFNVRIVISYKHYNLAKRMNRLIITSILSAILLIIGSIIFLF